MASEVQAVPAPRQRRPVWQFSLASLLIATALVAIFVGPVVRNVWERRRVVAFLNSRGGFTNAWQQHDRYKIMPGTRKLPFIYTLFGETNYHGIFVPESVYHSKEPGRYNGFEGYLRIESLFPEARIFVAPLDITLAPDA